MVEHGQVEISMNAIGSPSLIGSTKDLEVPCPTNPYLTHSSTY